MHLLGIIANMDSRVRFGEGEVNALADMCVAHWRRDGGDDAGGRTGHGAVEPAEGAQQSNRSDYRLPDSAWPQGSARADFGHGDEALLSRSRQGEHGSRHDLVLVPGRLSAGSVLRSDRELFAFQQSQPVSKLPRPAGLLP